MLSISNGNLDSIWIIELPVSVWYRSTTLLLVSPTVECTSALPNLRYGNSTVVVVGLSIELKVYSYNYIVLVFNFNHYALSLVFQRVFFLTRRRFCSYGWHFCSYSNWFFAT